MSFLDRMKDIILPKPSIGIKTPRKNKVSLIIDEIVYAFEESIELMSTSRTLMFHTAFVAYVPQSYYKDLHLAFGVATQEIVEIFNEKLNERLKKNKSLKFMPIYDFWSFDIIPLKEEGVDIPDEDNPESKVTYEELEERFVAVRSSLVPNELYNFSTTADDDEVKTNQSQPNSKCNRIQKLSIGAIRGLKPSGNGYSYPINLNGGEITASNTPATNDKVLAILKSAEDNVNFIDIQGNKYQSLDIKLSGFFVGGASASTMYQGKPMVRLDSESIQSPHFEIKQNSNGAFLIRPIGHVELSQIPIPKNEWSRLSDRNASIKINGNIELIFNKK